ncbi:MAG: homoserine O-acetyltransferase [Lentisphaerae bacterium GWF2_52_8]|nr:MAG: homoserine O-acetyltransferase [Lentisphaerae bacterium GWF2_52_8]
MAKGNIGIVAWQELSFGQTEEDALLLDCGRKFGPVTLRYETYGTLNALKNNAILILHALSGDAHVAGFHSEKDRKPGWWHEMVGPGQPFDTDKYFIVCSNIIGGCSGSTGPGSINPATGQSYNMDFPVITIADMVRAQKRLMEHLGIKRWLALGGGSMGGMQALEWAVSFPDCVAGVLAIATTSRLSPQGIAFNWVGREAIMSDPLWQNGDYDDPQPEKGLSIARMLGHITYLSDESMYRKFGRRLQASDKYTFDFSRDFAVESYLQYQGTQFVERFDANSYLYITRAMDYFDLSAKYGGDLAKAFTEVKAKFLVVSFSSDWLFPPYHSRDMVKALLQNRIDVTYCDVQSSYGHDAFLLEVETLGRLITDYLANLYAEVSK